MDTTDRIMETETAALSPLLSSEDAGIGYRRGRTPWEIKEKEGEYKLRFNMPEMTKGDVRVWVEEKMLVIKAEKLSKRGEGEHEKEEEWSAKSYGKYSSRIALPENVEVENIKAEVKDGVLCITIPKAQASSKIVDIDVQSKLHQVCTKRRRMLNLVGLMSINSHIVKVQQMTAE